MFFGPPLLIPCPLQSFGNHSSFAISPVWSFSVGPNGGSTRSAAISHAAACSSPPSACLGTSARFLVLSCLRKGHVWVIQASEEQHLGCFQCLTAADKAGVDSWLWACVNIEWVNPQLCSCRATCGGDQLCKRPLDPTRMVLLSLSASGGVGVRVAFGLHSCQLLVFEDFLFHFSFLFYQ